jgi:predicted transcriptional regulator
MARPASKQPTEGELEILHVLWKHGPSRLSTICEVLNEQRSVATTTVATMLRLMSDKGLVKRSKSEGQVVWISKVSQQATRKKMVGNLIDRVFSGSAHAMISHLLEHGKLSVDERDAIVRMIEEKEGKEKKRRS